MVKRGKKMKTNRKRILLFFFLSAVWGSDDTILENRQTPGDNQGVAAQLVRMQTANDSCRCQHIRLHSYEFWTLSGALLIFHSRRASVGGLNTGRIFLLLLLLPSSLLTWLVTWTKKRRCKPVKDKQMILDEAVTARASNGFVNCCHSFPWRCYVPILGWKRSDNGSGKR